VALNVAGGDIGRVRPSDDGLLLTTECVRLFVSRIDQSGLILHEVRDVNLREQALVALETLEQHLSQPPSEEN
jgi:hypothetical protein